MHHTEYHKNGCSALWLIGTIWPKVMECVVM